VHPDPAGRAADACSGCQACHGVLERGWGPSVEVMDARHHDLVLAVTSHIPHLIAYSIVGTAADLEGVTRGEVIKYSAGGFRDFTRIAASDPTMWRDVFLTNKDAVLDVLGRVSEDLAALQRAIRWGDGEALFQRFSQSRDIRRAIIEAGQDTAEPDFGRHSAAEPDFGRRSGGARSSYSGLRQLLFRPRVQGSRRAIECGWPARAMAANLAVAQAFGSASATARRDQAACDGRNRSRLPSASMAARARHHLRFAVDAIAPQASLRTRPAPIPRRARPRVRASAKAESSFT
jgi:hypothetical protein